MSINFAAVHNGKPWRKHSVHKTLHAAIDGKDGAKNLLLRIGRVAGMWKKHGDVKGVFVWEDGASFGKAFRLDPSRSSTIQESEIEISKIHKFHKNKGCTDSELSDCFAAETIELDDPEEEINHEKEAEGNESDEYLYPDELKNDSFSEGAAQQVSVNRYERSLEARRGCISHYGEICQVCGLDFEERYGVIGKGFIHVHHVIPIASIGTEYVVDLIKDLVPVCPNCHAMLHRKEPPLSITELKAQFKNG